MRDEIASRHLPGRFALPFSIRRAASDRWTPTRWRPNVGYDYWLVRLGSPWTLVIAGGFHLPVSASDFGP